MARLKAKKQWDETMAASGIITKSNAKTRRKRVSGRTIKLSKAMKEVDQETRALVRDARLESFEADNYIEVEEQVDPDDLYVDNEEEEFEQNKQPKKEKRKRSAMSKRRSSASGSTPKRMWVVKTLAQIMFEDYGDGTEARGPNYLTAKMKPSKLPPRHFCVICGLFSSYTCRRCGSRFCSMPCQSHHQEIGCLKFNL